jgi:hypothetical protein
MAMVKDLLPEKAVAVLTVTVTVFAVMSPVAQLTVPLAAV